MVHKILNISAIHHHVSDPEQLSDRELLELCQHMGNIAVKSRRMFIGLLPLVARRKVYDVKKFSSIFHFALMVGGVSYDVVDEVLRLDAQLIKLPLLRRALYRGEIGWSKIRAVLSLVTSGNETQWLGLLRSLSKPALEIYVRDYRRQCINERVTLFSNPPSCLLENNSAPSSLLPKNDENKAENFPGEITRLESKDDISQLTRLSIVHQSDKNQQHSSEQPSSSKLQELSMRREIFSFPLNSALAARLRLYRQTMEKRLKRLITWENVLEELLKKA